MIIFVFLKTQDGKDPGGRKEKKEYYYMVLK